MSVRALASGSGSASWGSTAALIVLAVPRSVLIAPQIGAIVVAAVHWLPIGFRL
jgi:hypothetical protein